MNYSKLDSQSFAGRLARMPLKLIPKGTTFPILQGRLRGKRWIVEAGNHGYWLGSFEFEKRLQLEQTVKEGDIIFDIGAHVGFYTLLASILAGPSGRVFAFEPLPSNIQFLRKHLALNQIQNVTIVEAAVSSENKVGRFNPGPGTSMGMLHPEGSLEVQCVTLDGLMSEGRLPVADVIKIDVEGAENKVLEGAKNMLSIGHPTLFLATHGEEQSKACGDFLRSLDYRLENISGDPNEILAVPR